MPIFKTEILGSHIEINYEVNEHDKLNDLIQNFKKRLEEFPNNKKVNSKTVIFLAALKIEDELKEIKKNVYDNKVDNKLIENQELSIEQLKNEIITTKNKLNDSNLKISTQTNKHLNMSNLSGKYQASFSLFESGLLIANRPSILIALSILIISLLRGFVPILLNDLIETQYIYYAISSLILLYTSFSIITINKSIIPVKLNLLLKLNLFLLS